MSALAVYDGRELVGEVWEDERGGWFTYDDNGHRIGLFVTRKAATAAVIAYARGRAS